MATPRKTAPRKATPRKTPARKTAPKAKPRQTSRSQAKEVLRSTRYIWLVRVAAAVIGMAAIAALAVAGNLAYHKYVADDETVFQVEDWEGTRFNEILESASECEEALDHSALALRLLKATGRCIDIGSF